MTACPHPEKKAYPSAASAAGHLHALKRGPDRDVHTYRCECGMWHVGHLKLGVRIARNLGKGRMPGQRRNKR